MANINIKSYNEVLGDMIRKIIADTPVNDINKGSVLLTLLEAAAANDYENNTAILNVLELLNIDALRNNDLDAFGSNLGLTRNTASKASGFVIVSDSTITKRSTSLYPVKPAPIATSTVINVNDASDWNQTGTLYIGRGTPNFEGPINYTSIVDNGAFFTINLASALEKDHLLSESVIDGQGTTDRQILAGTVVKVPANNINPEIEYTTLRDAVIPAGEDTSDEIPVVAISAGSIGNAGINTITIFNTLPFPGAEVTNTNAFTNGTDAESDEVFRDRIKAYSSTLARGTKGAILAAIDGVSDETDGKQVESAVITEPPDIGEPSIVYIDDGQGFQPSFDGQSVDLLIAEASGNEEFLQLANYPLPRPQVVNTAESPYLLTDGMTLKVLVDEIEESVIFNESDFRSISSATISEVVVAINDKASTFKCRLSDNSASLLLYPTNFEAETIQVVSDGTSLDANTQLKFPVTQFSYIALYQNNTLLKEIERPATLTTTPFATWDINSDGNLILSVDGTPDQDRTFTISDFDANNFNALTLSDWVAAFNAKYAGITATETTTGRMVITSNREGSASTLEIVGGSYLEKLFSGQATESVGQDSDFELNRQNGNLQIKTQINAGDTITAGSEDTKGNLISLAANGGTYNVSIDANNRPSEMVIVADAERVLPRNLNLAVGATITLTDEGSNVMRIMASTASAFRTAQPNDYIYITNRGDVAGTGAEPWVDIASSGLYKIRSKGEHLTDGVDTYVEVDNVNMVVGGPYTVEDSFDIQIFASDEYPQLWKGSFTANPAAAPIEDVVDSINEKIKGVIASIFRTNFIKLTSTTEEDGSIAIPVSVGNATQLFVGSSEQQEGTQSHIANRVPNLDTTTIFERTEPTNTNVWLDRYTYTDIKGSLTAAEEPTVDGVGTFSEQLEDTASVDFTTQSTYNDGVSITTGSNKKQTRDIRTIIDADNIGTRQATPRSLFDYDVGDEYQITKNTEISSEDNLVAIIDNDAVAKTIDIQFSRTGRINGGSQAGVFPPTNTAFSADDADNEPGIDFGSLNVWGTLPTQTNTNFDDYAVWFRARNWYDSNSAAIIVRAQEFGPIGSNLRFQLEYPASPLSARSFTHVSTPTSTQGTYTFASGAEVVTLLAPADQFTVTDLGGSNVRLTFPTSATLLNFAVGDVVSIAPDSGFSAANQGQYRVNAKNDVSKYIDIYNPNAAFTIPGVQQIETVTTVADVADSLDGTYFVLTAPNGDTIKFWFDNNNSGTLEPAIGLTTRSYEVNIATGDSAIQVATTLAAVMLGDPAITTATNGGGTLSVITTTWLNPGPSAVGFDGAPPTGFSFAITTPGVTPTFETLNIPSAFKVFPITDTDTSTIVDEINSGSLFVAVEETAGDFIRATREEASVAVNELGFGHDPNPANNVNEYVAMYDDISWVLTFQNANPNFELKEALQLNGVSSVYNMETTMNEDGTTGEYFKLVPVTTTNIRHHMVHKALSQLDIVSDVDFADKNKKVQIKSQLLGSDGAIEIVGGRANAASFKIIGDSQINTDSGTDYLEIKIPSSPNTLSPGQHVVLSNESGVERLDRTIDNDTIDVAKINDDTYEYRYNNKSTNFNEFVEFTIVDANSVDAGSYPTPGLVWRWTHNEAGAIATHTDNGVGVIANGPAKYDAAGTLGAATNLFITVNDPGSVSTALNFELTSSGQPVQADYVTFEDNEGDDYAVWFDIDGAGTAPTGATFTGATNQVEVDILSTDSPNTIMSKYVSTLLTFGIAVDFNLSLSQGATLADVRDGNILNPIGSFTGWDNTNLTFESGDDKVAGWPIINVNSSSRYIDVVNPYGVAMSATAIGSSGTLLISTSPIIEWRLNHSAKVAITSVSVTSNVATAITDGPHKLNVGDTFVGTDIPSAASPDTSTVVSVIGPNQFTYASTNPDVPSIEPGGFFLKTGETESRYKVESLGYNNLFRLSKANGDSPLFKSCGVAVDDVLLLSGSTFAPINNGEFRIIAVDEDALIYENINAVEELDTFVKFNNFDTNVLWQSNSDQVVGVAGAFKNLAVGDWVKKETDDDTLYNQISAFNTGVASTATAITLANTYGGITATTTGHALDQNSSIGTGVTLRDTRDIRILEGDALRTNDVLFISENTNPNWFNTTNSGTYPIDTFGTNSTDGKIFLRVTNPAGIAQTDVQLDIANTSFTITESDDNKFTTIRQVFNVSIDEFNDDRRIVYLTPGNRAYKWSESNVSSVSSLGKIGYNQDIVTGVDGYLYYIGLLRKVQRIIDGFEPDPTNFPGRKAVGSLIEVLPPLPRRVNISIDVTTQDGVNLSEISDEITSAIINYISDLGVGEDVILSDIIVRVKNIDGVLAVTFITPEPSEERIAISDDEKAFVESSDISVA